MPPALAPLHGNRGVAALVTRALAAVLLLVGGLAVASTTPAHASAADCVGGAQGFVDIPDWFPGTDHGNFTFDPGTSVAATVHLETASVQGTQRGYAAIIGNTIQGDQFWMDWTTSYNTATGQATGWTQCGPFTVGGSGQAQTTPAMRTDPSPKWRFRACGSRYAGVVTCTPWW